MSLNGKQDATAKRRTPMLSLCMIVKNEAQFIVDCLESVREAVDEMIVVDTGSTDDTPELARKAGARVSYFEWRDDFAAARNESIAHARGDWVLWLDADERLAPGGAQVIRESVQRDDFDCGYIPMHDAASLDASPEEVVAGGARLGSPFMLPKLLRRTSDLRFQGLVHENVNLWIANGRRTQTLPTAVVHLGYVPELRRARDKDGRNVRLLEKRVEVDPSEAPVYGFLAQEYLILGQTGRARETAERGWAAAAADPWSVSYSLRLAAVRAHLQLEAGDFQGALETAMQAEQHVGPHPDLHVLGAGALLGKAYQTEDPDIRTRCLEGAKEAYAAALESSQQALQERALGHGSKEIALAGLGTTSLLLGQCDRGLAYFEEALAREPSKLDLRLGKAEVLVAVGRSAEALSILELLLGPRPDPWLVAAQAAEALGEIEDCRMLLQRALALVQQSAYAFPHRRVDQVALECRLAAYQGEPKAGPGAVGAACALMAGDKPERAAAPLTARDESEVAVLVGNLLRLGHQELVRPLLGQKAQLALPGVGRLTHAASEAVGVPIVKRASSKVLATIAVR